jgi:uncharacterized low-complexity protein
MLWAAVVDADTYEAVSTAAQAGALATEGQHRGQEYSQQKLMQGVGWVHVMASGCRCPNLKADRSRWEPGRTGSGTCRRERAHAARGQF